jgi:hypothetical protein
MITPGEAATIAAMVDLCSGDQDQRLRAAFAAGRGPVTATMQAP